MISRILIVGYGSAGQRYAGIIQKNFSTIKCNIYSSNKKNKDKIFLKKFSDIKKFAPELSIICTPATKRLKIIKFLALLNSHLLVEKPLASNYKEVKKIFNCIKNKKLNIKIGYNLRYLNSLKVLNKIIKSNKIGKIYSININAGQSLKEWRKKVNYENTVSAQKKLGGGVLLELSHELDYALWIFGGFNKIFCKNSKISNLKIDVEDNAQILLFSKNKYTVSINLDFFRKDKIRKCCIAGENGSLVWDGLKNKILFLGLAKKKWININFKRNSIKSTYLLQLKEMIKLCNSKKNIKTNLVSLNGASKVVRLIEFARRSSNSLKVMNIK